MNSKDKIIKRLIEQAKKYGYLTYEDLNKTFDEHDIDKDEADSFIEMLNEIGVKIVEVRKEDLFKNIELDEEIIQEEPMRIFLNEINKIEPIDRKTELEIAKNIRMNEKKLLALVLSSPIALREINNWLTLVQRNEMTPKELMKRGRKTKNSLRKMRRKLASTIKTVNKLIKKIISLQTQLKNKKLPVKLRIQYQTKIDTLKVKIANKIMGLELNTERIKRLINRTQSITEKIIQLINETKKYEQLFSVDYNTVVKMFHQLKTRKISPAKFKRILGYNVAAAQTMFDNFQKVVRKLQHYRKEFGMKDHEIVHLNTQINHIMNEIEKDKMKLVQANLNLVVTFAKKFAILTGVDVNDLIQEGATGLTKAVEKFEWRKGYKFSTYAHWWIRQAISRFMADYTKTIRLPVHIRDIVSKMIKVYRKFQNKLDREISISDYTRVLKIPSKKIIDTITVLVEPISTSTPRGKDEDATIQDYIPAPEKELPVNHLLCSYKREVLEQAMEKFLDEREREILKLRYGFYGKEYTLEEVGKIFSITRERVRQVEAKAIRRLRSPEALEMLKEVYPVRD
ncbi:MAG: sigma-70 family RNA polymerase sigma factor [Endomicrobia bacterium]|nr:sigma-70 family RNA polymerase sigma factor [Endomicrobiia bacterium]